MTDLGLEFFRMRLNPNNYNYDNWKLENEPESKLSGKKLAFSNAK
jgi:hypothetical protein